jgi:hypothetical protein
MKNRILSIGIILGVALVMRCTTSLTGGSDNPDFRVVGSLVDSLGNPAKNTQVKLIPSDFNPGFDKSSSHILIDTTDLRGNFSMHPAQRGVYNILAIDISQRTRGFIPEVVVSGGTTTIDQDTLKSPGSIRVILPQQGDSIPAYIFIPGTDISIPVQTTSGYALIDSVPPGILPSICYVARSYPATFSTLAERVVVTPGVSTLAGKSGWNFSRNLYLNTTASGAGIAGNVAHFPILVRLSKVNFDFGAAKNDGSDLRFEKPDHTQLPFEIERWDAVNGHAEIWVEVDTVYGASDTQFLTMLWGNPAATSASSGAAVFDTANGFQGVWHMNETGADPAMDATINHYDGTPSTLPPLAVPGLIGVSQKFNGVSNYIMMSKTAGSKLNFPINGYYTVSAWVNLDSIPGVYKVFISKGYLQYTLQINSRNQFEISEFHDNLGWEYSPAPGTAKVWKYVVGVRDGQNQHLYIDGILATSTIINDSSTAQRFTGDQLIMGAASGGTRDFLNGSMDEMSISSVSRGSDWIKLCFMNQRADDKLVTFK